MRPFNRQAADAAGARSPDAAPPPPTTTRKPAPLRKQQWLNAAFTLGGLVLLAVLFRQVGVKEVAAHVRELGWSSAWILAPYAAGALLDCAGWACALNALGAPIPLARLYLIRLAGEAVNQLTPAGAVGGEPVKMYLLKLQGVSTDKAVASLVIARTALTVAQVVFILMGLPFFLYRLGVLGKNWIVLLPLLGLAYLFVRLLIRLQTRGLISVGVRKLKRVLPWLERWERSAENTDAYLLSFYDSSHRAFVASTLYHLGGWVVGVAEVAIILSMLGAPYQPPDPLILETMIQPLMAAALIIPGALGVQEAGGVLLCRLLGIEPALGLTLMVLRRARQTAYVFAGLLLLMRFGGPARPSATGPT